MRRSPYLLLLLPPFFWSCNWIIGRALHEDIPPMGMTFFRWLIAVLILAPFSIRPLRSDWPIVRAHWRILLLLGAIGAGLHNALAYIGLNFTTVTNGVILNSCIPVMIIVIAWLFFRERLRPVQVLGVVVSSLGVIAILSRGSLQTLAQLRLNVGDLFVMLSVMMWSLYTVLLRRGPQGMHMLSFLFAIGIVGVAVMFPLWIIEMLLGFRIAWTPQVVAAMGSVALFASVLAYVSWNVGVKAVGAQVAGLYVHLMPVYGVILAWIFLDERMYAFHVVGIALILAGIVLTSRRTPATVLAAVENSAGTAGANAAEVRK